MLTTAWLAECLALAGQHRQAAELLDRLVARASDLGLYAEQIEPDTDRHVGNFPQAFSHVGIIHAAWRLKHTARGAAVIGRSSILVRRSLPLAR